LIRRVRLVLLVVTLVVIQTSVFPHLRIFGAIPDLCLVATVAIAYEEGPQVGAIFGFGAGLAIDLFLSSPAGLSALAFSLTGYFLGVFQGGLVRESRNIAPVMGVVGGLLGGTIFVVVGAIVGQAGFLSLTSAKVVVVAATYDAVVAYLVFPFTRWADHDADLGRRRR
jgi:rod shape-determining protein MreD